MDTLIVHRNRSLPVEDDYTKHVAPLLKTHSLCDTKRKPVYDKDCRVDYYAVEHWELKRCTQH